MALVWLFIFLTVVCGVLYFLHRRKRLELNSTFTLGDISNSVSVLLAIFALSFSLATLSPAKPRIEANFRQTLSDDVPEIGLQDGKTERFKIKRDGGRLYIYLSNFGDASLKRPIYLISAKPGTIQIRCAEEFPQFRPATEPNVCQYNSPMDIYPEAENRIPTAIGFSLTAPEDVTEVELDLIIQSENLSTLTYHLNLDVAPQIAALTQEVSNPGAEAIPSLHRRSESSIATPGGPNLRFPPMLDSNQWIAVGTGGLAITAVLALLLAYKQLEQNGDEAQIQHLLSLAEQYEVDPMATYRAEWCRKKLAGEKEPIEEDRILYFFERIALLVDRGYLKDNDVWEIFSVEIFPLYMVAKDAIAKMQTLDPTAYSNFLSLVTRLRAIETLRGGTNSVPSEDEIKQYWEAGLNVTTTPSPRVRKGRTTHRSKPRSTHQDPIKSA